MIQTRKEEAHTFLTHLFGRGLEDERYAVETVPLDGRRRHPSPARRGANEGPARGEARDRLPESRPADAARAGRDHRLHGPEPRGLGRAVLGRRSNGSFRRTQAALR